MNGDQMPQAPPVIENPRGMYLPAAAATILQHMFPTHSRLIVDTELGAEFSGSHVFVVKPIRETPELPEVVKIAPLDLIEDEYRAYRACIRHRLSGAAEIQSEPISLPG